MVPPIFLFWMLCAGLGSFACGLWFCRITRVVAAVRADGKVETFKMERNALRQELDEEIIDYADWRSGVRR
jgi:hypothetical protein